MNPQDQQTPIATPAPQPATAAPVEQLTPEEQRIKDEKYANALVAMANLDYSMQEHHTTPQKHFISQKKLIYIVISTIITILSFFITPLNPFKSSSTSTQSSSAPSTSTNSQIGGGTQTLLNDTKELEQDSQ